MKTIIISAALALTLASPAFAAPKHRQACKQANDRYACKSDKPTQTPSGQAAGRSWPELSDEQYEHRMKELRETNCPSGQVEKCK
jgi:hypothetical protein